MGGQACNGGFANHPGIEMTGSENLVKGRVQHIETACQRAESWQDEAGCIFDKTPSPQHSTALAHTRAAPARTWAAADLLHVHAVQASLPPLACR